MNVLFYSKIKDGAGRQLQNVVETLVPAKRTKICRNIFSLSRELCQLANGLRIAVLLATDKEDLSGILSVRELLRDVRIILVLPDQDKDSIKKGHTMWPRFLTYASSDFSDVAAVLRKMLQNGDPGSRKKEEIAATQG